MNSQGVARVLRVTRCLIALGALTFVQQTPAPPSAADALFARAVAVVENDARSRTRHIPSSLPSQTKAVAPSAPGKRRRISATRSFSQVRSPKRNAPIPPRRMVPTSSLIAVLLSAPRNLNPSLDPSTSLTLNSHPVNAERTGDEVGPVALAVDQNFGLTRPRAYRVANDERTIVASSRRASNHRPNRYGCASLSH